MAHVWEKSYPSGVRWDTPLPPAVPLDSLLETAATRWPDRIATMIVHLLIANYMISQQEQQKVCRHLVLDPVCMWDCTFPTRHIS